MQNNRIALQNWEILQDFPAWSREFQEYLKEEQDSERLAYIRSAAWIEDLTHAFTRRQNPCLAFRILNDTQFCGFVLLRIEETGVYLADFYIKPHLRNQGIGTAVLHLLQTRYARITLTASQRAVSLYQREGFRQNGRRYEDNGQPLLEWHR